MPYDRRGRWVAPPPGSWGDNPFRRRLMEGVQEGDPAALINNAEGGAYARTTATGRPRNFRDQMQDVARNAAPAFRYLWDQGPGPAAPMEIRWVPFQIQLDEIEVADNNLLHANNLADIEVPDANEPVWNVVQPPARMIYAQDQGENNQRMAGRLNDMINFRYVGAPIAEYHLGGVNRLAEYGDYPWTGPLPGDGFYGFYPNTGMDHHVQTEAEFETERLAREHREEVRRLYREREKAAAVRAEKLLLSLLNEKQTQQWESRQEVTITGPSGLTYRLSADSMSGNVSVLDHEHPSNRCVLCVHVTASVPMFDNVAAQILAIRYREQSFLGLAVRAGGNWIPPQYQKARDRWDKKLMELYHNHQPYCHRDVERALEAEEEAIHQIAIAGMAIEQPYTFSMGGGPIGRWFRGGW